MAEPENRCCERMISRDDTLAEQALYGLRSPTDVVGSEQPTLEEVRSSTITEQVGFVRYAVSHYFRNQACFYRKL